MEQLNSILGGVRDVFEQVFIGQPKFSIDLRRESAHEWDSLQHVIFLIAIEKKFGVKFDGQTASKLNSIKTILDEVEARVNNHK